MTFIGSHAGVGQDSGNGRQRFACRCEIAGLFLEADNVLTAPLSGQLKRRTPLCTALGAIPAAMPILIGAAGASMGIGFTAWRLFGILFLWQFPHFLAIAIMYRDDYARAGYKMLPRFEDAECKFTRVEILGVSIILVATTVATEIQAGAFPTLLLMGAGAILLFPVAKLLATTSRSSASGVLHASVLYLPVVLAVVTLFK